MDERDTLDDLLAALADWTHREVASLSLAALTWQPDPLANGVGVTVWHYSRWLDVLATQVMAGHTATEELWQTEGWATRTGYDPRGIGYLGLGAITDYTPEEAAAVPVLAADGLLAYFDQALGALREGLAALPAEALHSPTPALGGKRSPYEWVKGIAIGCFGHCGEVAALNALRGRAADRSAAPMPTQVGAAT